MVDADACPVKDEIYRVARRHGVGVRVVANQMLRVPVEPGFARVIVGDGFDAADDWIADRSDATSIVVTSDILLAERCVKAGAVVMGPDGRPFDHARIGGAVAMRALMADLRAMGSVTGGPAPFSPRDRSAFLQALDGAVVKLKRQQRAAPPTIPAPPAI
ncbi:YaiI/YqxD family protein [Sphingomonas montana]|uniref:YaiI/YqxD family protein n=1 Tax=Sphingomonas montana TaxID=1843236 RepID=UPI0009700693|nr:YaiI/YqxD family protein [Sphingomonas montana]